MDRLSLKEALSHGTPDFSVAVYNILMEKEQSPSAPLHYHNEFELLVCTKGCLTVQIEEDTFYLNVGQGLFINSGLLHSIASEELHGFIAVVFGYNLICSKNDISFNKYIRPLMNGALGAEINLNNSIFSQVVNICNAYETASFGFELYIKHSISGIIFSLIQNSKPTPRPIQSSKSLLIKNILDYIEENYAEPITLNTLSERVHISKEYLCRVFRSMSESSPIEYLNRYRIQKSAFRVC